LYFIIGIDNDDDVVRTQSLW